MTSAITIVRWIPKGELRLKRQVAVESCFPLKWASFLQGARLLLKVRFSTLELIGRLRISRPAGQQRRPRLRLLIEDCLAVVRGGWAAARSASRTGAASLLSPRLFNANLWSGPSSPASAAHQTTIPLFRGHIFHRRPPFIARARRASRVTLGGIGQPSTGNLGLAGVCSPPTGRRLSRFTLRSLRLPRNRAKNGQ
jgi:hypothetical protein